MTGRFLIPVIAFAASGLSACSSPLSPNELLALQAAEARWAARPFQAYTFETRAGCFCDPVTLQWARVEVTDGSVTRVVLVDSGEEVDLPQRSYFPSVERLFALIRHGHNGDWVKDVAAEYDPLLGYPTFIRIVPDDGVLDGGSVHYARGLTPAP